MSGRRARSAIALLSRYRRQCMVFLCVAAASAQTAIGAQPVIPEFAMENPAPGIYVHYGQQAEMTPANVGGVANLGFVVGAHCVAVIDTAERCRRSAATGNPARTSVRRGSIRTRIPTMCSETRRSSTIILNSSVMRWRMRSALASAARARCGGTWAT